MAVNMWQNILKSVESDNKKILYETLLDFFYSETVLTFWISLVYRIALEINFTQKKKKINLQSKWSVYLSITLMLL